MDVVTFDLDDSKSRPLVFYIGYRYLPTPGQPPINRMEPVVILNFPLGATRILLSDQNRFDLNWQGGGFTWRYRNRFQLERTVRIRSYRPSPYASVELFYNSKYGKWSDTAIYAGRLFPSESISNSIRTTSTEQHWGQSESAVEPAGADVEPVLLEQFPSCCVRKIRVVRRFSAALSSAHNSAFSPLDAVD
jgi:hypothetical protein